MAEGLAEEQGGVERRQDLRGVPGFRVGGGGFERRRWEFMEMKVGNGERIPSLDSVLGLADMKGGAGVKYGGTITTTTSAPMPVISPAIFPDLECSNDSIIEAFGVILIYWKTVEGETSEVVPNFLYWSTSLLFLYFIVVLDYGFIHFSRLPLED
nr:hypothetical protein Iba_chr04dCG7570 [Ipomoea batatas]